MWKDKAKAYHKEYQKTYRRTDRRNLLDSVRERYGCCFCGPMPIECIEFHHINPDEKEIHVSQAASKAKIIEEMLKCVTVCANCHCMIHRGTLLCPQETNIDKNDLMTHATRKARRIETRPREKRKPCKGRQLLLDFSATPHQKQLTVKTIKIGSNEESSIDTTYGEHFRVVPPRS